MDPAQLSPLAPAHLGEFQERFSKQGPLNAALQNAVASTHLSQLAASLQVARNLPHTFSDVIDCSISSDQKQSGRCWMFAGLAVLRYLSQKKLKSKEVEFSPCYLFFFDKLERANVFLHRVAQTARRPLHTRLMHWFMSSPQSDGGYWSTFASLVDKYGLVPSAVMPETVSSTNSALLNHHLRLLLHSKALEIRSLLRSQAQTKGVQQAVEKLHKEALCNVYHILSLHLGTPPSHFSWQYTSSDKIFHSFENYSPLQFFHECIAADLNSMCTLMHDPRRPYMHAYSVPHAAALMAGGMVPTFINVPFHVLKLAALRSIVEQQCPVWFGSPFGAVANRKHGILDPDTFQAEALYGLPSFRKNKVDRLECHELVASHAMTITGVDLEPKDADDSSQEVRLTAQDLNCVRRWRVENSHGQSSGIKGFYVMSNSFFEEDVLEAVVPAVVLPHEVLECSSSPPTRIPPWDPVASVGQACDCESHEATPRFFKSNL
jgi:bleomycin hydrolase